MFAVLATDSFTSYFAQLKDDLNLRVGIGSACRRQSSTLRILRARTILWTHALSPFIASGLSHLHLSFTTSELKEKRVSVEFVSTCFIVYVSLFFLFYFFFFLISVFLLQK